MIFLRNGGLLKTCVSSIVVMMIGGGVCVAEESIAPTVLPLYEACTKTLHQAPTQQEGCSTLTLMHECEGDRYVALCTQTPDSQACQMSNVPIPPRTSLGFQVCLSPHFLIRHAACQTVEGCAAFAHKKPAR